MNTPGLHPFGAERLTDALGRFSDRLYTHRASLAGIAFVGLGATGTLALLNILPDGSAAGEAGRIGYYEPEPPTTQTSPNDELIKICKTAICPDAYVISAP